MKLSCPRGCRVPRMQFGTRKVATYKIPENILTK